MKAKISDLTGPTCVEMAQLVMPEHTNTLGGLFGGMLMSWIDISAAIAAQKHARRVCVTASMDQVHFLRPVRLGFVVYLKAQITMVKTTSCEVRVTATGENPRTGDRFEVARAFLTFVAVDDKGAPVAMPPFKAKTAEAKRMETEAMERRAERLAWRARARKTPTAR